MRNETLQVRLTSERNVAGSKNVVRERIAAIGYPICWLRANGSATLYFLDHGKRRQVTWKRFQVVRD